MLLLLLDNLKNIDAQSCSKNTDHRRWSVFFNIYDRMDLVDVQDKLFYYYLGVSLRVGLIHSSAFASVLRTSLSATIPIPNAKVGMSSSVGTTFYKNLWSEKPLSHKAKPSNNNPLILLLGSSVDLADRLKDNLEIDVKNINGTSSEDCFLSVFDIVKEKMQEKTATDILVVYENADYTEFGFLSGMLKSAEKESSKVRFKMLGLDQLAITNLEVIEDILKEEGEADGLRSLYQVGCF